MGLKGDSLALASGMLPVEYRQLCQFDPLAELAAQKGRADSEMRHALKLNEASENGDAKASLAILQHVHGWTAKTEISVDVYQKISILTALEQARSRVADGLVIDV
jgi:replication fork clamp-binding protein CrfC